jgi:hypothetical protein
LFEVSNLSQIEKQKLLILMQQWSLTKESTSQGAQTSLLAHQML